MNMTKMTKVQLIQLVQSKDAELVALRDKVSVLTAECHARSTQYVDRRSLLQRAGELARDSHVMHRVVENHIECFTFGKWRECPCRI